MGPITINTDDIIYIFHRGDKMLREIGHDDSKPLPIVDVAEKLGLDHALRLLRLRMSVRGLREQVGLLGIKYAERIPERVLSKPSVACIKSAKEHLSGLINEDAMKASWLAAKDVWLGYSDNGRESVLRAAARAAQATARPIWETDVVAHETRMVLAKLGVDIEAEYRTQLLEFKEMVKRNGW